MNASQRGVSMRFAAQVIAVFAMLAAAVLVAAPAQATIKFFDDANGVRYSANNALPAIAGADASCPTTCSPVVSIKSTVTIDSVSYRVKHIGDEAFLNKGLTSVTIPPTVTTIGDSAFQLNSSLTTLVLGNGVITIGPQAFANGRLENVTIPDSVTTIGEQAFIESALQSVVIGTHVVSIGENAFDDQKDGIGAKTLKSVRFRGSMPTFAAGDESFDTSPSLLLHYPEFYDSSNTSGGYTNPIWRGYTAMTLDPKITGNPREGFTVTAEPGSAVPATGTSFTYKWIYAENDAPIAGATGKTLHLTKGLAGHTIKVIMTSTSPGPDTETVTSFPLSISSPYKRLVLSTRSVKKGTPLLVTATGLKPHQKFKIQLNKKTRASGRADANGTVSRTVTFKSNTKSGKRLVKVIGSKAKHVKKYSVSTKVKYYK